VLSAWEPVRVSVKPNKLAIEIVKKRKYSIYLRLYFESKNANDDAANSGTTSFPALKFSERA
jgi:hypothetical protein